MCVLRVYFVKVGVENVDVGVGGGTYCDEGF